MAKILLKNYDELIVTEDVANKVQEDKLKQDDLNLPYTIQHVDGLWVGTLKDIATVSSDDKRKPTHFLKDHELIIFHNKHGYGVYDGKYESGYGYLDVPTQYLIGAGLAKFTEYNGRKNLIYLDDKEKRDKYNDLWADYITKIDEFHEPRQSNNTIDDRA